MIQDCRDNEGLAKEQPQQYYSNFNIEYKSDKIIWPNLKKKLKHSFSFASYLHQDKTRKPKLLSILFNSAPSTHACKNGRETFSTLYYRGFVWASDRLLKYQQQG